MWKDSFFEFFSSFDGFEFQETKRSVHHSETFGLGSYRGNPFTVGTSPKPYEESSTGDNWKWHSLRTEIFYMDDMDWSNYLGSEWIPDYPFAKASE